MIEINLLPPGLHQRTQAAAKKQPLLAPVPKAFPLAMVGVAGLMALLIIVSTIKARASDRQRYQAAHDLKLATVRTKEAERITAHFPTQAAQYTVLASRLDDTVRWAEILRTVSLRCPAEVQIISLDLQHDRRTGERRLLVIRGVYTGTASLDLEFANSLKASATFARAFESVIPEKNLEPDDRTSFAISCQFRPFTDELAATADEAPRR